MTDDEDDPILDALVDGSVYDRLRVKRFSHFKQSVPRKLAIQSALLGLLALLLPVYALYPPGAGAYVPSLNPAVASPKVLLLGVFGGVTQFGTAALLVGATLYRFRHQPLTERQATEVLNAETFATYFGFGTGGLAVAVTLCLFLLGLGGESTLGWYITTMDGANPFVSSGMGLTVTHVATGALAGSIVVLSAWAYLAIQLSTVDV
jgi:hypothetical protein